MNLSVGVRAYPRCSTLGVRGLLERHWEFCNTLNRLITCLALCEPVLLFPSRPRMFIKVFESAPVDTSPSAAPVIAYCNGGVASTVALFLLFQLRHLGGRSSDVAASAMGGDGGVFESGAWANYDGSWNEWGNDESALVER